MEKAKFNEKYRNYKAENLGIKMLAKKVKSCISEDDIRNALINNGFKGVYILSNEAFCKVRESESVSAYYMPDEKKIIVNSACYEENHDIVIHELVHAYLDCKNSPEIEVNEECITYGHGLEEGCCAIIQNTNTINNIDNCIIDCYRYQSHLIRQLNVLYKYSPDKKYPNLIHHLLKEPADFLPAIERTYEGILNSLGIEIDSREIALKSALAIVTSTDAMLDNNDYEFTYMYSINSYMNTVYLFLANKQIRDGKKVNLLFPTFDKTEKTKEDHFEKLIFKKENGYFRRQVNNISSLLMLQQDELEQYSNYTNKNYSVKTKKK